MEMEKWESAIVDMKGCIVTRAYSNTEEILRILKCMQCLIASAVLTEPRY